MSPTKCTYIQFAFIIFAYYYYLLHALALSNAWKMGKKIKIINAQQKKKCLQE